MCLTSVLSQTTKRYVLDKQNILARLLASSAQQRSNSPTNMNWPELHSAALLTGTAVRKYLRQSLQHLQVWADGSTDQSVVIEVMEHSSDVADCDAGAFFFNDMATVSEASSSRLDSCTLLSESWGFAVGLIAYVLMPQGSPALPCWRWIGSLEGWQQNFA